jgi:hypothetical protein
VTTRDWVDWHRAYEDPESALSARLACVRGQVAAALDAAPAGPLTAISLVAGRGLDLIDVLATHPRGRDVRARLVELDPALAADARAAAAAAGLPDVDVVTGDAAGPSAYDGVVPADLVLLCGLFGNVDDADVIRVVAAAAGWTRAGGRVVWTRHRDEPGRFEWIGERFVEAGFAPVYAYDGPLRFGVGAHVRPGPPGPAPDPATPLFTFAYPV